MTSSPIRAARSQYLLDLLAQVPDPRKRRGRRHALAGLLAVGISAVIAGSRSFAAIGQWAADAGPEVLARLGAAHGPAEESTFRRAFALVSADVLDGVLGAWLWTRPVRAGGRLVIAIDGKTVRGAKSKGRKAPRLVAAWRTASARCSARSPWTRSRMRSPRCRTCSERSQASPAQSSRSTMHTQTDTAKIILGQGSDYVMTVKRNMPTLYRQLKKLPWAAVPAVSAVSTDHGRRAPAARSRPRWRRPGSSSRVPPRSRNCAVRSRRTAGRPSRSSTSSPATAAPTRPPWPPGSAATGK